VARPARHATGAAAPRFGLVGAGRWGAAHREALARAGAPLTLVATGSEASAERVRADWGVAATTSLDELLAGPIDAVVIASPNDLHARQAIAAIDAGRHVLVEKPLAVTAGEARAVEAAAAARPDLVVAVGHEMRAFGLFEAVKRALDEGRIGPARHLALSLWRRPYRSGSGGWKSDPARLGSTVLEEPIHYLDLARWLLGEPREVLAWAVSRSPRESGWEALDVRLTFADGVVALVTRSIGAYGHAVDLRLTGGSGALRARWEGRQDVDPEPTVSLTIADASGVHEEPIGNRTGHAHDLWRQTAAFVAAIVAGAPPLADARDGRIAVELCLAVERSLRERVPVPVSASER
jgi:myo-inositol 2-dehydrogenase / D-chiro-inositol 1-dehydrogenase